MHRSDKTRDTLGNLLILAMVWPWLTRHQPGSSGSPIHQGRSLSQSSFRHGLVTKDLHAVRTVGSTRLTIMNTRIRSVLLAPVFLDRDRSDLSPWMRVKEDATAFCQMREGTFQHAEGFQMFPPVPAIVLIRVKKSKD